MAATVELNQVTMKNGEMDMVLRVKVMLPAQNKNLPYEIEKLTIEAGREFMKEYYRLSIERADLELILNNRDGRDGAGIQRYGHRPYTFKTSFGVVRVKRIRIKHKADGSTEVPSAKAWGTPRQAMITAGLKAAVCNLVVKQSFSSTVRQLEAQTGQARILSKSTVGNILHSEGQRLAKANEERAAAVFATDNKTKNLLGRAEIYLAEEFFEQIYLDGRELTDDLTAEELQELLEEIHWDPRTAIVASEAAITAFISEAGTERCASEVAEPEAELISEPEREIIATRDDKVRELRPISAMPPSLIVVQPDEVVVGSQEQGQKWLINYSAVVSQAERNWYFSAGNAQQLFYQVGGLLASLGLNNNSHQLLMISDGAHWIRRWYESIGIENKKSVMCWEHLKKRCWRAIREGLGNKAVRAEIKQVVFSYLWRGKVAEARQYLSNLIADYESNFCNIGITNIKSLISLNEYLSLRQEHLPNYHQRLRTKQWIASVKVEKFNDWSVSVRCKKQNGSAPSEAWISLAR